MPRHRRGYTPLISSVVFQCSFNGVPSPMRTYDSPDFPSRDTSNSSCGGIHALLIHPSEEARYAKK
ncbi:MAG: hypothetical protein K9H65_03175 [Bacteroidales bacterium]|nr:hypothetical protein [Bacteroidales bacterium]